METEKYWFYHNILLERVIKWWNIFKELHLIDGIGAKTVPNIP